MDKQYVVYCISKRHSYDAKKNRTTIIDEVYKYKMGFTFNSILERDICFSIENKESVVITDIRTNSMMPIRSWDEYYSWSKDKKQSDFLQYELLILKHKRNLTTTRVYTWEEQNAVNSKDYLLEIYDKDTEELLIKKSYQRFPKLLEFVHTKSDPSDAHFSPSDICVNRYCRVLVNHVDISKFFIEEDFIDLDYSAGENYSRMYFKRELEGKV